MKIADIVNRELTNIATCEAEPIHIPGSIQPHGMLLAVDATTEHICYCSANTAVFTGLEPAQLLGQHIGNISKELHIAVSNMPKNEGKGDRPIMFSYGDRHYDVIIHRNGDRVILEFEPAAISSQDEYALFSHTQQFISFINRAKSLKELCASVAHETRRLTGYDRVMIYRFDKEYNGEVFAESTAEGAAPFLGLHYPHTDIPAQARELYLRNLVRMIVDVHYDPVPLLTIDTGGAPAQLDLSDASLRSVSPIHIQYLKNMGVGASLTISLLLDEKLWGLIACHHATPKLLSYAQRQQALLQGHFLTSQIKVRQVAEEYDVNITVEAHLQQLLNKIDADEDFSQKFEQFTSLLPVANATGVAVLHNGKLFEKGQVPPREKVLELIKWIAKNIKSVLFSTSCLQKRYPEAKAISKYASGIVYHALGKPTENCIIWFREEVEQTVKWAGRPDTAVQQDPQTKSLTPRASFEIWKEQVRYQSNEWRVSEINAAIRFATSLQNHFHLLHTQNEERNLRVLNEKLQNANRELSNINWITSHDLKEPLRKIQVFASRITDREGENLSEVIKDHILRIQNSAGRMQQLVDDILSYSLANNANEMFAIADLNLIVAEVTDEMREELKAADAHMIVGKLPENVRVVPYQMVQLFSNLFANAVKFARNEAALTIEISSRMVSGADIEDTEQHSERMFHCITVKDNGIGFENIHAPRLFDIFYRLHSANEYKGTGIGLAICKKIMENHGGAITAKGEPDRGAVFNVYLPA